MRLLIAGEGSRDRVWGPVFTRGPVQFRQKKISKLHYWHYTVGLGLITNVHCTVHTYRIEHVLQLYALQSGICDLCLFVIPTPLVLLSQDLIHCPPHPHPPYPLPLPPPVPPAPVSCCPPLFPLSGQKCKHFPSSCLQFPVSHLFLTEIIFAFILIRKMPCMHWGRGGELIWFYHRRRIKTEEKVKVVTAVWGTEFFHTLQR